MTSVMDHARTMDAKIGFVLACKFSAASEKWYTSELDGKRTTSNCSTTPHTVTSRLATCAVTVPKGLLTSPRPACTTSRIAIVCIWAVAGPTTACVVVARLKIGNKALGRPASIFVRVDTNTFKYGTEAKILPIAAEAEVFGTRGELATA